jgi:hypothetical protein
MTKSNVGVSSYPVETEVPSFQRRAKCWKCGRRARRRRPYWKEQPAMPTKLRYD